MNAHTMMPRTDSLPLDAEGLNQVCLRATAAAKAAEQSYAWAAAQTPGSCIARKLRNLAGVEHAKAEALLALLERARTEAPGRHEFTRDRWPR